MNYRNLCVFFFVLCLPVVGQGDSHAFDLLIENGRIIDGTGSPWYAGDIGIRDGRIAAIGRFDESLARETINAAGLVVAPGFIATDMVAVDGNTIRFVLPPLAAGSHSFELAEGSIASDTGERGEKVRHVCM